MSKEEGFAFHQETVLVQTVAFICPIVHISAHRIVPETSIVQKIINVFVFLDGFLQIALVNILVLVRIIAVDMEFVQETISVVVILDG